ncbi:MAG: 7-carboxy-7-deazaguanine synthase QueE [Candidatus Parvarchaeum sp.]
MMSTNLVRTENDLWLYEISRSIQGEGRYEGLPVVIVRLMMCNLKCSAAEGGFNCDTAYTWDKNKLAKGFVLTARDAMMEVVDESVKSIEGDKGADTIMLTGGEPLIWQHYEPFNRLLEYAKALNFNIHVETNGTQPLTEETKSLIDFFAISPKQTQYKNRYNKEEIQGYLEVPHIWKFVIRTQENMDDAMKWLERYDIPYNDEIYLMPEGITAVEMDDHITNIINPFLMRNEGNYWNIKISGREHIRRGLK